jgi:hypothetical protein
MAGVIRMDGSRSDVIQTADSRPPQPLASVSQYPARAFHGAA